MSRVVKTLVLIGLLIVSIFYVPVTNIILDVDNMSQGLVDNAVHEFVDDARCSGKITVADYEEMVNAINGAQALCDISITYGKKSYVVEAGTLVPYYDEYNEYDILDVLYADSGENGIFYMAVGDRLNVIVKNTSPTLGMKLLSIFVPSAERAISILSTYGGYVSENGLTNI